MALQMDVVIVGTGTAALAAAAEVRRVTEKFIIVSNGVEGTTCVRAGCMPSKALIHAARLYHQRHQLDRCGVRGCEGVSADMPEMFAYVRSMRDHFLHFTLQETESYRKHIVPGKAWFHSPVEVEVNGKLYHAKSVVLATGSSPIVPPEYEGFRDILLTSDSLFEQEMLPPRIGVVGLDVLGTEMAQAFAHMGLSVVAFQPQGELIGGLSDPEVNRYAVSALGKEMDIYLGTMPVITREDGHLQIGDAQVDGLFIAMGRKANLDGMGLEECGIVKPGCPIEDFDPETMQVSNLPLFVAGDVKSGRSLLHNATDEGKIAGYNAARGTLTRFRRRTGLQITHTHPAIAVSGKPFVELGVDRCVVGEAAFDQQGTATVTGIPCGIIRIYADRQSGVIEGAEIFAPEGEHLAHMLAWLVARRITVCEALELPFYHPSAEECLRSALYDAAHKLDCHQNRVNGLPIIECTE